MRYEHTTSRFNLIAMAAVIIMLFLALTWTPAYGYSMSRVDNLTGGNSGGQLPSPDKSTSLNASGFDNQMFDSDPLIDGDRDDHNTNCPPEVPEPATLLLIGFGLAGGAALRRFRQ